jgi:glutamate dehydrogenase
MQVLKKAIPATLQGLVPLPRLLERLPESYLNALFAAFLASRFVYEGSMNSGSTELALHQYLLRLREE